MTNMILYGALLIVSVISAVLTLIFTARPSVHVEDHGSNQKGAVFVVEHKNYERAFWLAGLSCYALVIVLCVFLFTGIDLGNVMRFILILIFISFPFYWLGCVYEDFPFINIVKYTFKVHGDDYEFSVRGGGWEKDKKYLWLPDDSGVLTLHCRDLRTPMYIFPVPSPCVSGWGKTYTNIPPFAKEVDYARNIKYLEEIWESYGYLPSEPDKPVQAAPLVSMHSRAKDFFSIFIPGHPSKRVTLSRTNKEI